MKFKQLALGLVLLVGAAVSQAQTAYNSVATAYVTTTITQAVVFDSTMQAGGTFEFSVLAHNGGGRQGQSDTANVKIQFYDSSNTLVSSVNTNYSNNLPQPTASSGTNTQGTVLSGNPQADPAVPWTLLSVSSTNCGGSCANVAYAKVTMYGVDGSFWAGDYGPWYRAPTFTLNGGGNLLYNPEFGPYNGINVQGWTLSPALGACQGAWGGSNACIVNSAGVPGSNTVGLVANQNGGGPSATGGTTSGTAGGYSNSMSVTNPGPGTTGGAPAPTPAPAPTGPVAITNSVGTTASNPNGTTTLDVTNSGTYTNNGINGAVTNSGTFTNSSGATTGAVTNSGIFSNSGTTGTVNNQASGTFTNNNGGTTGAVTNAGTFSNAGTVASVTDNTGTFSNTGTVTGTVTNHGAFTNSGTTGAVTNAGTFNNSGTTGSVSNMGTFSNTGTVSSVAYNNSTIYNHGTVTGNVSNGGHFNNYGDGAVGGTITSTQDTSVYNAGFIGTVVLQSNAILANEGTVDIVTTGADTVINNLAGSTITNGFTNDGTLNNAGTVADIVNNNIFNNSGTAGAVTNNGTFDNALGGTVASLTNTATATNEGTITGTVTNTGTFTNSGTTGDWTNNATVINTGTMGNGINYANATFTNGGTVGAVDNQGTFNNAGTTGDVNNSNVFVNAGAVGAVTNTGTFNNTGTTGDWTNNATVSNAGTMGNGTNYSVFTNTGTVGAVNNQGTFTNTGTVASLTNSGTFTQSTGNLNLSSYAQTSTGSTVINGGQQIVVSGAANLGGNLTVLNGPTSYGKYTYLTAAPVTGQFDSYTGTGVLRYTSSGVQVWVMPDGTIVQSSVNNLANSLSNMNSLATGSLTGGLGSDCAVFGTMGACVSVNYGNTKVASGDLNSGGVTIAKRINANWRIGFYASQALNSPSVSGVKFDSNTPAMGGFIGWNQNENGQGLGITVSAIQGTGNYTIGNDKTGVTAQAAQVKASYTVAVNETTTVTPYFGVRNSNFKVNGYTESGSLFPLTYSAVNQTATDVIAGVSLGKQFTDKLSGNVGVGVVQNISYNAGSVNASSDMGNFTAPLQGSRYTSSAFSAGLGYEVVKNQKVGINFGWQQKSLTNANISSMGVSYTIGF